MITVLDLNNIVDNKMANEAQKRLIMNNMPSQIAERMCAAIDVGSLGGFQMSIMSGWWVCGGRCVWGRFISSKVI